MSAEKRVENLGHEENRSLGKMPQGSVRDAVRARNIAECETSDGFMNLVRFG